MKKTLSLLWIILILNSCSEGKEPCTNDLAEYDFDLEDVTNVLINYHKLDSLEKLVPKRFTEVYRLTWSGGWTSSVYFTIGRNEEKYHLFIDGYIPEYKKGQRKVIELEEYEWIAITNEIRRTNFWCSKYYSGNIERAAMDGSTFYFEGIKDKRYHAITWQFDGTRDRLLNRILKASNMLSMKPYLEIRIDDDSLLYKFAVLPIVNSQRWGLITEDDTVFNSSYGETVDIKIHKKDTTRVQNWKLLQMTYDSMINEIPIKAMEINLSRNSYD